jgi:ATP-dependent Zn protease
MLDERANRPDPGGPQQSPGNRLVKLPVFTLVAWAGIIAAAALMFFMKQHPTTAVAPITQAEFLDRLGSNQIAGATVTVNQQTMPLVEIAGAYWAVDANGKTNGNEIPFTVHNYLMAGSAANVLTHSKNITMDSPNTTVTNLLWGIAPFLILGLLFWFFFVRQIKRRGGP